MVYIMLSLQHSCQVFLRKLFDKKSQMIKNKSCVGFVFMLYYNRRNMVMQ